MAAPATPRNLYVQQGNGQVFLSWDICTGATSYTVQRSTDNVTFSSLGSAVVNNYLDTTCTIGTQYFYKVYSTNSDGDSSATSSQSAIPAYTGIEPLGALRLQAQQRADRVNSNFVTLPEWNNYINQSYFELYDLLVSLYEDYYYQTYVFQTDGTSSEYALPNGVLTDATTGAVARPFYKLLGVDLGLANNNNAKVSVHKFDLIERNRYVYPNITSTFMGVFNLRYRIMGSNIKFIPTPSAGQYITLWYVPRLTRLLKDIDMCDGVSGWTEYIIIDAAIKALQKEESDVSVLMAQKQALIDRIQSTAMNRDAGQPDTISPTRNRTGGGGYGGPGWDGAFGGF